MRIKNLTGWWVVTFSTEKGHNVVIIYRFDNSKYDTITIRYENDMNLIWYKKITKKHDTDKK